MDLHTFVRLCREFAALGDAIGAQADTLVGIDGDMGSEHAYDHLNPNAVRHIVRWLERVERSGHEDDILSEHISSLLMNVEMTSEEG